nr:hypothetical protein [Tanacetum cinerariifolium]
MSRFHPVLFPSKLSLFHQHLLEKDVSMKEIKSAVWECVSDKRQSPMASPLDSSNDSGIFLNLISRRSFPHSLILKRCRLFRLYQDKDCLISDHFINNQWVWNWSPPTLGARNFRYW